MQQHLYCQNKKHLTLEEYAAANLCHSKDYIDEIDIEDLTQDEILEVLEMVGITSF